MEEVVISLIESVLTFAGVLVTGLFANRRANKDLTRKVDRLVEHDREQYLSLLRLTIMNESMPVSERIIAGDKYIRAGGNGDVKEYYQAMLREHIK